MALYPNFQYQFAVNQVRTAQTLNSLGQLPLLRGTYMVLNGIYVRNRSQISENDRKIKNALIKFEKMGHFYYN